MQQHLPCQQEQQQQGHPADKAQWVAVRPIPRRSRLWLGSFALESW